MANECLYFVSGVVRQCSHITEFLAREDGIDIIVNVISYTTSNALQCCEEGCWETRSMHACLECASTWCSKHTGAHFSRSGHSLALVCPQNLVLCGACASYIHNEDIPWIALKYEEQGKEEQLALTPHPKRAKYVSWAPEGQETRTILEHAMRPPIMQLRSGLRGLLNLGSTCFIGSILQSLMHNAPLRNWFLSDQHNPRECRQKLLAENNGVCLACDMDHLFQAAFGESTGAISPHSVLYSLWKYRNSLAGYEQQDAHEFFIAALDALHVHTGGVPGANCECVIHQLFGATLRSQVTCSACGASSTSLESCLDISVEIPEGDHEQHGVSIEDCLKEFTREEQVHEFACGACKAVVTAHKRLSIERAPVALCIHIKRFQSRWGERNKIVSTKLTTRVAFPLRLDLTPYITSTLGQKPQKLMSQFGHSYRLYSVVNHQGTGMLNGHYTCFFHHARTDSWIKADDEILSPCTAPDALNSQGYILYYMRGLHLFKKE